MTRETKRVELLFGRLARDTLTAFPPHMRAVDAPAKPGVYVIYDPAGAVVHVGRTPRGKGGIRQRLRDHLVNRSSFTRQHLNGEGRRLRDGYTFRYVGVEDARERALLEAYAIGCLCPAHLGLGEKDVTPIPASAR